MIENTMPAAAPVLTPAEIGEFVRGTDLESVADRVFSGTRLSFDDGLTLYRTPHVLALGALANWVKERKTGSVVTYIVNHHINYSNFCATTCLFCAFAKNKGEKDGYEMTLDEIVGKARGAVALGATEVHIVGGLHPDWPWEAYPRMIRAVKAACPTLHVKAFTAVEIAWFASLAKKTDRDILVELKDAGLDSLPGGGAEIFAPRVRKKICPGKADADRWLAIHREAHRLGIPSTATMLYGHIEGIEDRVDHILRLRSLQDEAPGFTVFIPLAFHPDNTYLVHVPKPTGLTDLRNIAAGRLLLDNFPHIKAYWIMMGLKTAQAALSFGADDLDGTVVEEKIYHMAGAETPQGVSVGLLEHLIRETGRTPVQRDSLYGRMGASEIPAAATI